MTLTEEQAELLNIQQQVLRGVVIALGCLNPAAMPAVVVALRASASDERFAATASQLLGNLADSVEAFAKDAAAARH